MIQFKKRVLFVGFGAVARCTLPILLTHVEISPKKAYVSLRRNKQFAIVQPSTATRVDLGINLKNIEATGRLELSGSFNAMVSHRVRLSKPGDVDAQVLAWLKAAYEAS